MADGKISAKDRLSSIIKKNLVSKPFNEDPNSDMQMGNGSENFPDFSKKSDFNSEFNNDDTSSFNPFAQEKEDSFDGFSEYNSQMLSDDDEVPMKRMIEKELPEEDNNELFDEMENSFNKEVKENKPRKRGRKSQEELNKEKEKSIKNYDEVKNNQEISLKKDNNHGIFKEEGTYNKEKNNMFNSYEKPVNNQPNQIFESIIKKLAMNLLNQAKSKDIFIEGFNKDDMEPIWDYIINKVNN